MGLEPGQDPAVTVVIPQPGAENGGQWRWQGHQMECWAHQMESRDCWEVVQVPLPPRPGRWQFGVLAPSVQGASGAATLVCCRDKRFAQTALQALRGVEL